MSLSANWKMRSGASRLMRPAFALLVIMISLFCAPCKADIVYTYTYTGDDFTDAYAPYTTSDSMTGWFTTSAPLGDNIWYGLAGYSDTSDG